MPRTLPYWSQAYARAYFCQVNWYIHEATKGVTRDFEFECLLWTPLVHLRGRQRLLRKCCLNRFVWQKILICFKLKLYPIKVLKSPVDRNCKSNSSRGRQILYVDWIMYWVLISEAAKETIIYLNLCLIRNELKISWS